MQILKLESEGMLAYYAGDIIPTETHKHPTVITAFDLNRKCTFQVKIKLLDELRNKHGILFYPHDIYKNFVKL